MNEATGTPHSAELKLEPDRAACIVAELTPADGAPDPRVVPYLEELRVKCVEGLEESARRFTAASLHPLLSKAVASVELQRAGRDLDSVERAIGVFAAKRKIALDEAQESDEFDVSAARAIAELLSNEQPRSWLGRQAIAQLRRACAEVERLRAAEATHVCCSSPPGDFVEGHDPGRCG